MFGNAHFKKQDGSRFIPADFLGTALAARQRRDAEQIAVQQRGEKDRIEVESARHARLFQQAKKDRALTAQLEKTLPVWARMTEEEKRARGLL